MRSFSLVPSLFLFAAVACSNDNPPASPHPGSGGSGNPSGSGGASGGAPTGIGGSSSGGQPNGSGGSPTGTGGEVESTGGTSAGSGGDAQGQGFVCPAGSDALTPVLQGKTLTPITGVPEIVNNGGFLEGPLWYEGKLYLSQLDFTSPRNGGDILVYTPGGAFSPFIEDQGTNGLAVDDTGRLIAASVLTPGIFAYQFDNPTAAPTDIAVMYDNKSFNSPNDVTVRSDGTVYFTDPTHNCSDACGNPDVHGVYRVPPGGAPELITTTQDQPNGITLSPDEKTLYIGGTTLTSHPVMPDGSVGAGTALGNITDTDGLTVDCAGNLYVALHSMGQVIIVDKTGTQLPGSLSVTEVTNLAFGGTDNKTLYVTGFGDNRGRLYSVDLEVPGFPF